MIGIFHIIGGVAMIKGTVGAGILSIITESLYDKPIVVFREYVQNSVDALSKTEAIGDANDLSVKIWANNNNTALFFLDNGTGIQSDKFQDAMKTIANSGKIKTENIGYKGIGRLSGIPYCKTLSFVNIIDYSQCKFQKYDIDCSAYGEIQKSDSFHDLDFDMLMSKIGTLESDPNCKNILKIIEAHADLFADRNTGFLVMLKDISTVLKSVIEDEQFIDNLSWLLPAPFSSEVLSQSFEDTNSSELFEELMTQSIMGDSNSIPAKSYNIFFENEQLYRPLANNMFRKYLCKSDLGQYAVCVHAFSNKKIEIDRKNPFSGIRVYIDNMLLCDENELIPALQQYGLVQRGSISELIQSVRGIGAMIYITDKINISANARRTFIDVTDEDSINFLRLIGEFVDSIFKARYALSGYEAAKRKGDIEDEKLVKAKEDATQSLRILARDNISLEEEDSPAHIEFDKLPKTEQKRLIKNSINKELNLAVKRYLSQIEDCDIETCFENFRTWFKAN